MINPNRLDESADGAAHGHLAAVGMAFLLGVALIRELRRRGFFEALAEPKIIDLLDLVALGTVADVARLKSLNRAFVTQGLKVMAARQNIGLAALAEAARLVKPPSCRDLGFALGPRINAGGRVGKSDLGVRLLTSTDPEEARDDRRRARPPQRGAARDRDAGLRAGRGAGRAAQADEPVIIGDERRLAPGRDRHRRRADQGTVRPAGDRHRRDARMGPARARAARSPAWTSARRCSRRRTAGCSSPAAGHAMAAGLTLPPGGLEPFRDFINERLAADIRRAERAMAPAAGR